MSHTNFFLVVVTPGLGERLLVVNWTTWGERRPSREGTPMSPSKGKLSEAM